MNSIADVSVCIQTSSASAPSPPSWFGEAALIIPYLRKQGVLDAIDSQVRFARRRFGHYEVIDFVAVLAGLRHQWRTHAGSFLRAFASLGQCLHGPLRAGSAACALDAQSLFGRLDCRTRRSPAHAFSLGSAGSPARQRGPSRWSVGSGRQPLSCLRCGWHARGCSPTCLTVYP